MIKLLNILNESMSDRYKFYSANLHGIKFTGKIKQVLWHGTNKDIKEFKIDLDYDYENEIGNGAYDFDLPYGYMFLTSDFKEASAYGRYVIPCVLDAKKIVVFKIESNAPSQEFDADWMSSNKMLSKFQNSSGDALEIRGYNKSTFITYPEYVNPLLDLAKKAYGV
jgi:hypothetical protein